MSRRPGTIERAVIKAAREASWIDDDVDSAAIWALRTIAESLDFHRRQRSVVDGYSPRDLSELAGRAIQLLRETGLTPSARYRLGLNDDSTESTLAEVLRLAEGRDSDSG